MIMSVCLVVVSKHFFQFPHRGLSEPLFIFFKACCIKEKLACLLVRENCNPMASHLT